MIVENANIKSMVKIPFFVAPDVTFASKDQQSSITGGAMGVTVMLDTKELYQGELVNITETDEEITITMKVDEETIIIRGVML